MKFTISYDTEDVVFINVDYNRLLYIHHADKFKLTYRNRAFMLSEGKGLVIIYGLGWARREKGGVNETISVCWVG